MRRQANTKHQLMCQPDKAPRTWVPQTRKPTWTAMWLPLPRSPHCPPPPGWAPLEPRRPLGPKPSEEPHAPEASARGVARPGSCFLGLSLGVHLGSATHNHAIWFPCMVPLHARLLFGMLIQAQHNLLDIAEARAPKRGKPAIIYSNIMYTVYISVYV